MTTHVSRHAIRPMVLPLLALLLCGQPDVGAHVWLPDLLPAIDHDTEDEEIVLINPDGSPVGPSYARPRPSRED